LPQFGGNSQPSNAAKAGKLKMLWHKRKVEKSQGTVSGDVETQEGKD